MASSPRIDELKKKFDENPRRYFAPLANEYRKAGDVAEAIRICRAHLPQQPGHMSGHIVFGQALYESGELDESRQVFEAALGLDPENLIALRHLGDIARLRGDAASARQWYDRVLEADPRNEEISGLIASLEADAGRPAVESAPSDGAMGWGDINPEAPAEAPAPAAGSTSGGTGVFSARSMAETPREPVEPSHEMMDLTDAFAEPTAPVVEMRESLAMPSPAPSSGDDFPELDGASFDAPAPADASSARTVEIDAMPRASADAPSAEPAAGEERGEAELPAPGGFATEPAPPPPAVASSPANDFGFEVMEFVPPPREAHAPLADLQGGEYEAPAGDATPAAFVTETMAELYLQQGFRDEALGVYKQLLAQNPYDDNLRDRVKQLEHGGRSSLAMAELSDKFVGDAQKRQAAPTPRSVRAFFGALAARRAPDPGAADAWGDDTQRMAPERAESSGDAMTAAADVETTEEATSVFEDRFAGAAMEPTMEPEPTIEPERASGREGESLWPGGGAVASDSAYASPDALALEPEAAEFGGFDSLDSSPGDVASGPDAFAPGVMTPQQGFPALDADLPLGAGFDGGRTSEATPDESALDAVAGMELTAEDDEHDGTPFPSAEAHAGEEPPPASASGALAALFDHAAVGADDEQAASTLASVFTEPPAGTAPALEMPGRPTRAASSELSLDHVFRDPSGKAEPRRSTGGFSFDQFFSESAGGTASAAPPPSAGAAPPDASSDIEQFNAWLEGLKKK